MTKTCKRCGATITLTPDPDCPTDWAERLANLVEYCGRCADWGWSRFKLQEAIERQGVILHTARTKVKQTKQDEEAIGTAIANITGLCKQFAARCCQFYRASYLWDDSFADDVVQRPDKTETLLGIYENGIRHAVQAQRRPVTSDP